MSRLALGTVQFGLPYGVANTQGQVAPSAVAAILQRARAAGMDTLDTAIAYGESEVRLGEVGVTSWRVVTKLPPLPEAVTDVSEWVQTQVRGSLRRLQVIQLDGLLLHKTADFLGPHGGAYARALREAQDRGWIRSAGISIYDPAELSAVWSTWRPDLVQAPYNVFDRRLQRSGWLDRLRDAGVRVHVRSAFLQGLLLMPVAHRPKYFERWRTLLDRWADWCGVQDSTALAAALSFVLSQSAVEQLVVGVDSLEQLEEILVAARAETPAPPPDLYSDDRELIEPSRWKLT